MRFFLHIQYKGTAYSGWQKQPNAITVQEKLDHALRTLLQEPIETIGSGRTDKGVHASTQVVHFDSKIDCSKDPDFIRRANKLLPHDISVITIQKVTEESHARFSAKSRAYRYIISPEYDVFSHGIYYRFTKTIDIDAMNLAAKELLNYTDFECFSKVHTEVSTFNCTIHDARWRYEDKQLVFYIKANRFLRGMVRAIVGTLLDVGQGKTSIDEVKKIIESKDRGKAGRAVPAEGLFLCEVNYPKETFIGQ
ncbi:MAG: tRNA pseudouridine(38-40) synthase TruA [Cyclobacteriaceae bacterium]